MLPIRIGRSYDFGALVDQTKLNQKYFPDDHAFCYAAGNHEYATGKTINLMIAIYIYIPT